MAPSRRQIRALGKLATAVNEQLIEISGSIPQNQLKEFELFVAAAGFFSNWEEKISALNGTFSLAQITLFDPTSASLNKLNSAVDEREFSRLIFDREEVIRNCLMISPVSKIVGSEETDAASKRKDLIMEMAESVQKLCEDWQDKWSKEGGKTQESTEQT
ncbi:hypothetical protein BGW36DRAFT_353924 [Talaromyces proteolyticus]|uniref:Uncharacterized protein n=1 Tax=Talaromyces proteolyticus TaxID=1131652 RepID=A0AAD4Q1D4_9EURO|nr:uncharacterized protein BGW36DRAFT_353924 [Talaromyces proteolyticus]KAH8705520.1 hypothetical protein BGW36DRAFT_353924 [Talaromyces proteolyticus]